VLTLKQNSISYSQIFLWGCLVFLTASNSWFSNKLFISISHLIYLNFILLFIINIRLILKYLKYIISNNIKILDTYIFISIFIYLFSAISSYKLNLDIVIFASIYFLLRSWSLPSSRSLYKENILYGVIICALISSFGIFFGIFEYFFMESSYFFEAKNTPSLVKFFPVYIGGFYESYNQTAYILIAALGVLGFVSLSKNQKFFLEIIFCVSLLLSGAKIVFLFFAVSLILKLFEPRNILFTKSLILLLSIGYLFLAHIVFTIANEVILYDKYYRDLIFQIDDINIYLSLFSWLKIESFNYLINSFEQSISIADFNNFTDGYDPHFLLASLTLIGGIVFACLVYIRILYSAYFNLKYKIKNEIFFSSLIIVFIVETIIWDSHHSLIFWVVMTYSFVSKNKYEIKDFN
jgi:hypothetical protein